jgi:hypothetical protein
MQNICPGFGPGSFIKALELLEQGMFGYVHCPELQQYSLVIAKIFFSNANSLKPKITVPNRNTIRIKPVRLFMINLLFCF